MESELLFPADVLVEDLEHELGDEGLHMLLVLVLSVDPLNVHSADIVLVLVAECVHTSDEVVPLSGQILKLIIKSHFMLAILDFLAPEVL